MLLFRNNMKLCLLFLASVAVGLVFCDDTSEEKSESASSESFENDYCDNYKSIENLTLADIAGAHYAKYYTSEDNDIYRFMMSGELDSSRVDIIKDPGSDEYNLNYTMVRKDGAVETNISSLTTFDAKSHTIIDSDSGKPEKFLFMAYEKDKYALIYYCFLYGNESSNLRMLLTKDLSYDLTPALEEDKKHNFTNPLVELAFKNKALIEPIA